MRQGHSLAFDNATYIAQQFDELPAQRATKTTWRHSKPVADPGTAIPTGAMIPAEWLSCLELQGRSFKRAEEQQDPHWIWAKSARLLFAQAAIRSVAGIASCATSRSSDECLRRGWTARSGGRGGADSFAAEVSSRPSLPSQHFKSYLKSFLRPMSQSTSRSAGPSCCEVNILERATTATALQIDTIVRFLSAANVHTSPVETHGSSYLGRPSSTPDSFQHTCTNPAHGHAALLTCVKLTGL